MEDYNWISATLLVGGKRVKVRQREAGDVVWLSQEGKKKYSISELDFTNPYPDTDFLAKPIADNKVEIGKREYWRKLRGDVFLSLLHTQMLTTNDELEDVLGKTDNVIRSLYGQDMDFFNDK